mgnify:CR=1 FL=1
MGVVINQSLKSTFSYYFGMLIGAVNTIILYPLIFSENPQYLGLIQILIAYSIILSTFTNLSLPSIIIRYFPIVKQKGQLFFFSGIISLIGFIIFCLVFYFFLYDFIGDIGDANLLLDYSYYIIPLVFFISFSDVLNAISRSYLDSSTPIFLNEVFLKIYSLITLLAYWNDYVDFNLFLKLYFAGYLLKFTILLFVQLYNNRLHFKFNISDLEIRKMLKFGSFVILGSTSALLISKLDMLMLGSYIGLENVAYYTIAFYIGNAIMIPARSINSIATPLVADAWKNNNTELIKNIYYKSSLNQLILGGFFFLCIWLNIDDIMSILHNISPKFSGGRYVVLFIALARIVHLISGVNSAIIINSRFYKFDLLSNIPFLIFIIITNHILIPSDFEIMGISISGINGAAFATFISTFLFISIKIIFVFFKFKIHPFSINTLKTIILLLFVYLTLSDFDMYFNSYFNIILKSSIGLLIFISLVYVMKISEDINNLILLFFNKIKLFLF